MDFSVVVTQMAILFAIVIAGYICGKVKLMNQALSKGLSNLIVNLTCPALIIASTMGDNMPDRSLILPLLAIGTITYAILLVIASYLPKLFGIKAEEQGLYSFMLTFGNVGFIGYPIVASIFGNEAVFYASVLNVLNTITVFLWGTQFVAGKSDKGFDWSKLYCPGLIGTYISILIVAFALQTPKPVAQIFTYIGNITVPGSLLIIGYSISQIPARHMAGGPKILLMSAFRLIILPLFVMLCLKTTNLFDPTAININTIIIAMPVASFGTIFCLKFGVDETVMAQGTFVTTLLSLLTIPLVVTLIL